ncbi:MAG: C-terminal binding protein [Candidatus Brocadiia bacterium]
MSDFTVVLLEHGYSTDQYEREIIEGAGGEFINAEELPRDRALELCRSADGILVRRTVVTAEMRRSFERCRVIVRYGVGADNVDTRAATEQGIIVGNVPDYCIDEVSTHALALLLCCVRDVVDTHGKMRAGDWDVRRPAPIHRMEGRTLGLIGLGQIGRAVARKASGWGLRLLASDPYVDEAVAEELGVELRELHDLCREADYVSLHVPLLPETHHLIGTRELSLMKRDTILVNTCRGPVVDTDALVRALDEGEIAGAALDVFEQEPPPADSPLRSHPSIVLTDHMAWYSEESQVELQRSAAGSIVTVCTGGLPGSLANPEVIRRLGRWDEWEPAACMQWRLKRMQRHAQ